MRKAELYGPYSKKNNVRTAGVALDILCTKTTILNVIYKPEEIILIWTNFVYNENLNNKFHRCSNVELTL